MRNFLLGILAGLLISSVAILWQMNLAHEKYANGHYHGEIDAYVSFGKKILNEFGRYRDIDGTCVVLFSAKDIDFVVVNVNGVKTIRVR